MEETYYFEKTVDYGFNEAIEKATELLKEKGFGVLTEIDVSATMKKKLDKDIKPYRILGACNPEFAYKAISAENKIGVLLPCNVIVQELDSGKVEVAAINPNVAMASVKNPALADIAGPVTEILKEVIDKM